ncbi:MAG: hypothetical protein Q9186_005268 [Xanthomendoza sp. 1 TL-2023]
MLPVLMLSALLAAVRVTSVGTKAISFFENFDNPPNGNPLVPVASNVGNTAGGALKYDAFAYSDHSTTAVTLRVPSEPYCIGSGVTAQSTQGQPGWGLINSTYLYFGESSIFYSCQLYDATGNPSVPTTCTIQVSGVQYKTGNTVVQELIYNPTLLKIGQGFNSTTFAPNFSQLTSVNVQLISAIAPGTLIVINFDNHEYTAYKKVYDTSSGRV